MMSGMIPFLVGFGGVLLYLVFRIVEVRTHVHLLSGLRKSLDRIAIRLYRSLVFGEIPHGYRVWLKEKSSHVAHGVVVFVVSILRNIERPLTRIGRRLRARAQSGESRAPSPFLKTITPKRKTKEVGKEGPDSV